MKWNHSATLLILAGSLLLGGCGTPPEPTTLPQPTQTEASLPLTTAEPETTAPTTEPDPILEAGPQVTVDRQAMDSVLYEDTVYVSASAFLKAAEELEYEGTDAEGYLAVKEGHTYEFRPNGIPCLVDGAEAALEHPVISNYGTLYLPLEQVCRQLNISVLDDRAEFDHLYCTTSAGKLGPVEQGVHIPILMYHAVSDDNIWGIRELFVSPSDLEAQVKYLVDNGYEPITFEDWDHLEDFEKPVMLTFDDGYKDNFTEAYPILQKYNCKATFFIIPYSVDKLDHSLTSEMCQELAESDLISVQSHTLSHPMLDECNEDQLKAEIAGSKLWMARITGEEPFVLCYPSGRSNARVRELTRENFQFGVQMNGGTYTTTDQNIDNITRIYISRYTTLGEFASYIRGAGRD